MEIASHRRRRIGGPQLVTVGCLLLCGLCGRPSTAVAQDIATAEALFREGRALFEAGNYAAACPKLAESQRQDPSSGTLLNLAACHEKDGKTATAWAEYLAAARLAITQHKSERAEECRRRAAELEQRLSYLTIQVANPVAGLEVRRNDVLLEAGSWGSAIPADPGLQKVRASAPGYEDVELETIVGVAGDRKALQIPQLVATATPAAPSSGADQAPKPRPKPQASLHPPASTSAAPDRRLAYGVGAGGLALLAVGGTFGALALSDYAAAKDDCPTRTNCSPDAMTQRDRAGTRANIANVGIGLGLVAVGVSVVLLLTQKGHPTAAAQSLPFEPTLARSGAGLSFREAF